MKKIIFFLISLFFINASYGQLKRANKYYNNFDYAKSITLYKRAVKRNSNNTEALEKLANAYRLIKNYQQAEVYYARLMKFPDVKAIDHFYYGSVLKNNNKIDDAREQFKIYTQAVPDDKKGEMSVRSCDEIKVWVSRMQAFEIAPVNNLNTSHSEFSPVFYKNKIVFASSRSDDMVNENADSWDNQPFLNVYASEVQPGKNGGSELVKRAKNFSWRVNTEYHDGPLCFNPEQNIMYITRVNYVLNKSDKNFINRPKIYISNLKGSKWEKPVPFPYNSDSYTVQHPAISADGQWLFFSSDMPGGEGGADIYVSKKEGESWGKPENLGPGVNTPGNEVFPYVRKDGMLYFSSDGHPGFGGLDLFSSAKVDEKYIAAQHLDAPLNSSTDDFGILFSEDFNKGYFSSDRQGGKGLDDIYSFTAMNKAISIAGKILFSKSLDDAALNTKVMLLTDDGRVVMVTTTDSTGFFRFNNLDPDKKYMVKLDENDPSIANKSVFYMADEKGKVIRITVINEKGDKFVFVNLPADPNSLPQLGYDDITIAGNILYDENPSKPLINTKINLVNEKGEIVQSTTTNAFGAFVFTNLPPDQNFLVRVDEGDTELSPNTKIFVTNKAGSELQSTTAGPKGEFKFAFLASDSGTLMQIGPGNDVAISGNLLYGSDPAKPMGNKKIYLVNEKGEVVKTMFTDANGRFEFSHLPADQKFLVKIDEKDTELAANTKVVITSKDGKEVQSTTTNSNGDFKFDFLATEKKQLSAMAVEDSELRYDLKGSLLSDQKQPIADAEIRLVDEKGNILKMVKTDAKGNFQFPNLNAYESTLFELDEKDKRLTLFKKIYLTNQQGEIIKEFTLVNGKFRFSILKSDQKSLGEIYVNDPWLAVLQMNTTKENNITNVENIYYEYGKADLLPEARKTLDKVINIMKNDPKLSMVVKSYTDSRSSYGFNIKLSQKRSQSVVDYIIANGIDKGRIKGKGFGEAKLLNKCKDGVACTEEEHAMNRRTEFKILRKGK